ncbi:MAG: hypothetical protein Ct9H90mP5_04720 [Acidimicrobiaceae bacterium]|nr:MAG: hypothetical protein Ct9H90mP5_04720 [Acidimicrobiaceae bacterium]
MSDEKIQGYAQAILAVASAESNGARVEERYTVSRKCFNPLKELKSTLSDASIPSARRQQIVEDLLDGQETPKPTVALVSMIVAAGMGSDIKAIADKGSWFGSRITR